MTVEQRLALLESIAIPIWLIDYVDLKIIWGNKMAIDLWGASTLEELTSRNMTNTSAAIRMRHAVTQRLIEKGESETRLVTFYPLGRGSVTVRCHISGFTMDDGRIVAMTQALDTAVEIDAEQLRGVDAIRRIDAPVTLTDAAGVVVMQNPASARIFGSGGTFHEWFVDETVARSIQEIVGMGEVYRDRVQARTTNGERWYAVEAHGSVDPVTGAQSILLFQMDVTQLYEMQQELTRQAHEIQELAVPILDVGPNVLAVPLMGKIDLERSRTIATRLLPEVVLKVAESVILDMTGVAALDVESADALGNVARGLQLLGAQPILTGIQPVMARVLVETGMNFGDIVTLRNLHEGLLLANKRAKQRNRLA
ncbi:MAG TPA: STAS domain-containing protein [Polyangium sp.]|nr:STAS domain-containing protein [Polyangium sp.]